MIKDTVHAVADGIPIEHFQFIGDDPPLCGVHVEKESKKNRNSLTDSVRKLRHGPVGSLLLAGTGSERCSIAGSERCGSAPGGMRRGP